MMRALLLALALVALPAFAGDALLQYHQEFAITSTAQQEHKIVLNATHAVRIKSYRIALFGPALGGSQYGWAYLWRDAPHDTLFLPANPFISRTEGVNFGADWLAVAADAEEQLCLQTQFPGGMPDGLFVDVNITYVLEP